MEQRSFVLPAILLGTLASVGAARAAPGDASAKPALASAPAAAKAVAQPAKPAPLPAPPVASKPPLAPTPNAVVPVTPPAAAPPAVTPPAKPSAKLPAPKTPVEAAVQQVVMLERAGRPIGIGTLLSGDGRILTALSPLTHGNLIDAHYPEGQIVRVKLSHSDRAWDLALLTPVGDARHAGLKASRDPAPAPGTKVHAVGYVRDKQLGTSDITIKAKSTLRGGDSTELTDALELPFAPKPNDVGGPLVDDKGEVVGIVARACSVNDKVGCTLAPYAVPVSALRSFLRAVPMRRGPYVGLEVIGFDAGVARGVRVAGTSPGSPAASAGLQAGPPGVGDVIVAVDGTPVASAEAFSTALEAHTRASGASGASPLRLTVLSEGRYHEVLVAVQNPAEPTRQDRIFQSGPARPWPRAREGQPEGTPNPYR